MNERHLKKHLYGIQKKALLWLTIVISVVFLAIIAGIGTVVIRNTYRSMTAQYTYVNDKFLNSFQNVYEELNQLTSSYVLNEYVQKSLCNKTLSAKDKVLLTRTLFYINKSYMDYYLWLDNKGNTYGQKDIQLDLEKFYNSRLYKNLGKDYSKTKLFWERDVLFGSYDMALFVGRYVHQLDTIHEPGIIYIKLNNQINMKFTKELKDNSLVYLILDNQNQICYEQVPDGFQWQKEEKNNVLNRIILESNDKKLNQVEKLQYGILCQAYDKDTGFKIITYVPKSITWKVIQEILFMLGIIFFVTYLIGICGIIIFSRKLTKPIKKINQFMIEFDDSKLNDRISIKTNTELDTIGESYNKMIEKVGILLDDIKIKERKLRKSEMDLLLYQIRPHFLYNTLDTIYMLARIQKEETIMKMIQALSKFLRINLNNGRDEITVSKELEHVSAYLEIQKIRNNDLFEYYIDCKENLKECVIIKMILQPIVENCIKYGFQDLEEGGEIHICVYEDEDNLIMSVENNGSTMEEQSYRLLNQLERVPIDEIGLVMPKGQGGFGIINVVKRLRLKYNNQIRFFYIPKDQGTECVIKISKVFINLWRQGEDG
ncbi:sensor histidine kinase [Anaerosacchariphilus polymeriproducens]|uniref:HAMP domain-containing protein n=1 Tax=Anaerosacchariphilus polymeriproducens TaxID=1812858 RepID=A0A371AS75_9FIRM|nr:histidine kinase [Anaerosacchariphilus polymeriproducens]RDU22392.1 HAMP domain-containing protein [Anaerosacchariphilus polymeriproducens]